jgi:hypothetical protein
MSIYQFIKTNNLQPADAVELVSREVSFPKHYAVYVGYKNGFPNFIANITDGVQLINNSKLEEFVAKYEVVGVERFSGSTTQRKNAIRNAFSRIGEKAYNLVFNNCEHFKNWVLHGNSTSKQVETIGSSMLIGGGALYLIGLAADKKAVQKAGLYILVILVVVIFAAIALSKMKERDE